MKGPRASAQYANCYMETTFLFYLFTQARHIKQRLSLAAIQPAAGKKPFPLINAGNPEERNIFASQGEVASQTMFLMNPVGARLLCIQVKSQGQKTARRCASWMDVEQAREVRTHFWAEWCSRWGVLNECRKKSGLKETVCVVRAAVKESHWLNQRSLMTASTATTKGSS